MTSLEELFICFDLFTPTQTCPVASFRHLALTAAALRRPTAFFDFFFCSLCMDYLVSCQYTDSIDCLPLEFSSPTLLVVFDQLLAASSLSSFLFIFPSLPSLAQFCLLLRILKLLSLPGLSSTFVCPRHLNLSLSSVSLSVYFCAVQCLWSDCLSSLIECLFIVFYPLLCFFKVFSVLSLTSSLNSSF